MGSWSTLRDINEKGYKGNASCGDTIIEDTKNCLIHGGESLIATLGLEGIVIIYTINRVMVAHNDNIQDVKESVEKAKSRQAI